MSETPPNSTTTKSKRRPWVKLGGKLGPWLKHYLNESNPKTFMNKTGAARAAGYNCNQAARFSEIGRDNSIKLHDTIAAWLDDHGLTRENNKRKLLELSEACETKFITIKGKIDTESLPDNFTIVTVGEQEKYTKDGDSYTEYSTVVSYNLAANETQRRTTDMMIKVLGQYATEKIDVTLDNELVKLMREGRKRAQEAEDE